ncbi:MAG: hypothetical protein K1X74_14835 [Pirellulales bacterium]|nr:hypothetical protein [Pirellulales bacterium]
MHSLLRALLLVTCGTAGIALACHLAGQAPQHARSMHPRSQHLPLAAIARPALREAVTAPSTPTTNLPSPSIASISPEAPASVAIAAAPAPANLTPVLAVPNPAVTQQLPQLPTGSPDAMLDFVQETMKTITNQSAQQAEITKKLLENLPGKSDAPPTAAGGPAVGEDAPSTAPTADQQEEMPAPAPSGGGGSSVAPRSHIDLAQPGPDGQERYSISVQNEDIHVVLEMIAAHGNWNILPTKNVSGTVSVTLNDVELKTALDAICKTNGLIVRPQGNFYYVGTSEDFQTLNQSFDRIGVRLFRPNYVSAADLQQLLTPLLTLPLGKISVTTAAEQGIASDADQAGGNTLASPDCVVVQDYESVLQEMEQIVAEIDQRPLQVAIEAMILSVTLSDENAFGVNWNFLLQNKHVRLATGTVPDTISPNQTTTSAAPINPNGFDTAGGSGNIFLPNGGLAFAFLDESLGSFITALETIGDTDVIASPRLMCLNKQRAEILIGAKLGYVSTTVTETSTAQTVEFLEVGAQLKIRPFVSTDGTIRMEVHPELSTGSVRIQDGFTLPDKELTQVTSNIMVRDGCTVVIGGLMREDLTVNTTQVPLLGSLPAVGFLFRQREETVERREILVLVTPHIVYDTELAAEGEKGASEFHRRQRAQLDAGNPLGRDYLGRKYLRKAQTALAEGDVAKAMQHIDLAVRFDPSNRAAIDLQNDLAAGRYNGEHHGSARMLDGLPPDAETITAAPGELPEPGDAPGTGPVFGPEALDGATIDPRLLDELEQGPPQFVPLHPRDPGQPGSVRPIVPGNREFP